MGMNVFVVSHYPCFSVMLMYPSILYCFLSICLKTNTMSLMLQIYFV